MFEKKIKPLLQYVGAIGAAIMSIMYIIIIIVLIVGFETHDLKNTTVFSLINAVVGLIIMQFLKIQGISFAKNLQENQKLIKEYYGTKTADKKLKSINSFMIGSTIKDIAIKGAGLIISSIGIIYIVIQGSGDYTLLLLAVVNLLMFISFGILSMNSAYEFYNNYHVPYMKEQLKNKNKISKGDIKRCLQSMEKNIATLKNK
jgi:hypothetical protein